MRLTLHPSIAALVTRRLRDGARDRSRLAASRGARRLQGRPTRSGPWHRAPPARTARRMVEGVRRPELDELDRARRSRQHQHPGCGGAARAGACHRAHRRTPIACRRSASARGARRASAGFSNGAPAGPRNLGTVGANLVVRGGSLRQALARERRRDARRASARGAAAEHATAGAGGGRADLSRDARARRRARAGARHRRRPTAARCDLTERRYRAGDVAELDVARARTEVAATESEALALDRRRAQLEHALAVLVGEVASSFALPATEWDTALPGVPAGVPATVLARRPDVSAAQLSMLAAQQRVGVAKAAWFPDISLTGERRLRVVRAGRYLQVVGPRVGHGRARSRCRSSTADGARRAWRTPHGADGRGDRELPRAGAGGVSRRRGPARAASHPRRPGPGAGPGGRFGRARHGAFGRRAIATAS